MRAQILAAVILALCAWTSVDWSTTYAEQSRGRSSGLQYDVPSPSGPPPVTPLPQSSNPFSGLTPLALTPQPTVTYPSYPYPGSQYGTPVAPPVATLPPSLYPYPSGGQTVQGTVGPIPTVPLGTPVTLKPDTVAGTVYFDANANGKPDLGERAIKNLELQLDGQNFQQTRRTLENGTYEFTSLPVGKYTLSLKLPPTFGLSAGELKDIMVDGRTPQKSLDLGVARADQLTPTPRPTADPATSSGLYVAPFPSGSQGSAGASRGAPSSGGISAAPTQPTPAPPATATSAPSSTVVPAPSATVEPTRTPSAIDSQQAASERARAALGAPIPARTGSTKVGDDVLLDVPFRSALDGSEYADSNSGTASVGMGLEAFGFNATTSDLRSLANLLGRNFDVGQPPRIEILVRLAEQAGLRGVNLFQGVRLAVWSVDNVRDRLRDGYPVLTMIHPEDATGDGEVGREHFVLIVGLKSGAFIYHDPSFADARGANRTMSDSQLAVAWANGPGGGQAAGLALGRAELGLLAGPDQLAQAQQAPDRFADVDAVPTATARPAINSWSQLLPAPDPTDSVVAAADAMGQPLKSQLPHPLLLAFWATAGIVLLRVAIGFFFD